MRPVEASKCLISGVNIGSNVKSFAVEQLFQTILGDLCTLFSSILAVTVMPIECYAPDQWQ